jgi:hypothetical protein
LLWFDIPANTRLTTGQGSVSDRAQRCRTPCQNGLDGLRRKTVDAYFRSLQRSVINPGYAFDVEAPLRTGEIAGLEIAALPAGMQGALRRGVRGHIRIEYPVGKTLRLQPRAYELGHRFTEIAADQDHGRARDAALAWVGTPLPDTSASATPSAMAPCAVDPNSSNLGRCSMSTMRGVSPDAMTNSTNARACGGGKRAKPRRQMSRLIRRAVVPYHMRSGDAGAPAALMELGQPHRSHRRGFRNVLHVARLDEVANAGAGDLLEGGAGLALHEAGQFIGVGRDDARERRQAVPLKQRSPCQDRAPDAVPQPCRQAIDHRTGQAP